LSDQQPIHPSGSIGFDENVDKGATFAFP
jgi:hypothetical protein